MFANIYVAMHIFVHKYNADVRTNAQNFIIQFYIINKKQLIYRIRRKHVLLSTGEIQAVHESETDATVH